jgi:hypothetical protein
MTHLNEVRTFVFYLDKRELESFGIDALAANDHRTTY